MTRLPLPGAPEDPDDIVAAELVLGVLEARHRRLAQERVRTDQRFARMVAEWTERLAVLNRGYDEVAPPPHLWASIEARVFPPNRGLIFGRRVVGFAAGAITAAALVAAAILGFGPLLPLPSQPVARLSAENGALRFDAVYDQRAQSYRITRVSGDAAPSGHSHELWLIAPGAQPVALGVFDGPTLTVALPRAPAGWTLAVSLEPAGGSPSGAPTGPVLAAGLTQG